jgi:RecB family exonuclease
LYAAAISQCDGIVATLEQLTGAKAFVPKVELDLIVDEVTADAPDPGTSAQAGHVCAASRAAQLTTPFSTVIWWDPSSVAADVGYPWSGVELAALRANGVELPETKDVVARRAREWLRPILAATERLLLVVHTREEGAHPVLGQIEAAFSGIPEWRAEQALLDGALPLLAPAPLELPAEPLAPCALPARRRWWTLPSDVVVRPRDGESYSSLAKLFDYPHGWVLRYAAKLRPGRAAELPGGALLFGNLAHRLMELWFAEHGVHANRAMLSPWLAEQIPRLLEREGATLLEPGAGVERQRVVALLERALERLVSMVGDANVERVDTEVQASASFEDTALSGAIDLLLTDARGGETVVDVKWGGEPWRTQELADNRQLQLATYAYLRQQATGRWPAFAFFIVATGNLLAHRNEPFRDAIVVPSNTDEGIDGLWQRMVRTYAWRRAQLASGQVEVVVDGTLPTEASVPPIDGLVLRNVPDRYDAYAWLTGVLR